MATKAESTNTDTKVKIMKAEAGLDKPKVDEDELAALDALEKEASEFNRDAEIDRILKTFKLDA